MDTNPEEAEVSLTHLFAQNIILTHISEFTSNILQTRASNVNLALVGRRMGLDKVVIVNPSQAGMVSDKVMATTVEALIGAVYMDSNSIDAVRPVLAAMGLDGPA